MKEIYETPEMRFMEFMANDITTASGELQDGGVIDDVDGNKWSDLF